MAKATKAGVAVLASNRNFGLDVHLAAIADGINRTVTMYMLSPTTGANQPSNWAGCTSAHSAG